MHEWNSVSATMLRGNAPPLGEMGLLLAMGWISTLLLLGQVCVHVVAAVRGRTHGRREEHRSGIERGEEEEL